MRHTCDSTLPFCHGQSMTLFLFYYLYFKKSMPFYAFKNFLYIAKLFAKIPLQFHAKLLYYFHQTNGSTLVF